MAANIAHSLEVDGIKREADVASTMFQTDPHPGGHRYRLVISVDPGIFEFLKPGLYEPPDEQTARRCLARLTRSLRSKATEPCRFFLNTVERLAVSEDYELELEGTCSPIVER